MDNTGDRLAEERAHDGHPSYTQIATAHAHDVGGVTPERLVDVLHTTLTGGVPRTTRNARSTGLKAFVKVCKAHGWKPPYIDGINDFVDLCRILLVLDTLGHEQGLSRSTVSECLTSTKHHYTVDRQFLGSVARVWGEKGHHHPLVTMLLKSIPLRHRTPKKLLNTE
jgi:hypothetical protein